MALEGYGDDVITIATDARDSRSIGRQVFEFGAPNLGQCTAVCDRIFADIQHHDEVLKRYGKPLERGPLSPPPQAQDVAGPATTSGLCARYGLKALPPGWDAIDVAQAAARHGAGLAAEVDRMIARGGAAAPSVFAKVIEKSREAALKAVLAEYRRAGVTPPAGDTPTSLAMMLKAGWRIEEIGGRRQLVSPSDVGGKIDMDAEITL